MDYTISHFTLIALGYHQDLNRSSCPSQTLRCPGACDFPPWGHVVIFGSFKLFANHDWYLPVPSYGSTWVVLWLLFCRYDPSMFPGTWSTLKGPFQGVPSLRLYSDIDHIHLSIEAQCVSHHLPPVDCHIVSACLGSGEDLGLTELFFLSASSTRTDHMKP